MKPKKKKDKNTYNFSPNYVRSHRTFPVLNTVVLAILAALQIVIVVAAVLFEPTPLDYIRDYTVTIEPLEDGSLDIQYDFVWEANSTEEPLTWVSIGMANPVYTVYPESLSRGIENYKQVRDDNGYVALELFFYGGIYQGTTDISFKINQKNMLCKDIDGYFYEFTPCWFNEIPVDRYTFRWKQGNGSIAAFDAQNGYYTWTGALECGEYQTMTVRYAADAFDDAVRTVNYHPFDDSDCYNGLAEEKIAVIVLVIIGVLAMAVVETVIVDSYVSYSRGRGFLSGGGHHMHVYGRRNPLYIGAYRPSGTTSGPRGVRFGGGGGGGCACACACACAGGGRAGCSQKDTYFNATTE